MTLPAQDIVERLRYVTSEEVISTAANHDIHEAADTISRLTADNEALRAERDEARGIVRDIHWMAVRVGMCNDALRKAYDGGWLVYQDGRQNDIDPQYARDGMFDVEWRSALDNATARADALAQTLADAQRRIVGLYDGIAPQAHYENELGINGHRTGNRYADNDEIVQRIRAALANEEAGR